MAYSVKYKGDPMPGRAWYVNGPTVPDELIPKIEYLQADGDELEHIKNQYKSAGSMQFEYIYSIPMPMNRIVVRWYGCTAQTIVANL